MALPNKKLGSAKMQKHKYEPFILEIYNLIKRSKGFPVACVFVDVENKQIVAKVNKKSIGKVTDYKNHAEFQCLENISDSPQIITAIITLVPCSKCLLKMVEFENVRWNIYYIFDAIWEKSDNEYIKKFKKSGHKIREFEFNNLKSNISRAHYYYCIRRLRDAIKSHFFHNEELYNQTIKKLDSFLEKNLKYSFIFDKKWIQFDEKNNINLISYKRFLDRLYTEMKSSRKSIKARWGKKLKNHFSIMDRGWGEKAMRMWIKRFKSLLANELEAKINEQAEKVFLFRKISVAREDQKAPKYTRFYGELWVFTKKKLIEIMTNSNHCFFIKYTNKNRYLNHQDLKSIKQSLETIWQSLLK